MKYEKIIALVMSLILVSSGMSVLSHAVKVDDDEINENENANFLFAEGSGTESDPYQISNVTHMQSMNRDLDGHYELVDNIDVSVTKDWNNGKGFVPVGTNEDNPFTGSLYGQGYEISGLWINRSSSDYVGLFGYLGETSSVEDVGLVDVNVSGVNYTGGLVGVNDGTVNNSSATGDVSGDKSVGGLVGWNYGTVNNSYATGDVSGVNYTGGLVGRSYGGGRYYNESTVSNSFWDVNTTAQSSSDGGTGKTTAEMKDIDTFTDTSTEGLDQAWDFIGNSNDDDGNKDIWNMNKETNDGYPFFVYQKDMIPPTADAGEDITVDVDKTIILDANDSTDNGKIVNYVWTIEDKEYEGKRIKYNFTKEGNYPVALTVTDEAGNIHTDVILINVKDNQKDNSNEHNIWLWIAPIVMVIALVIGTFGYKSIKQSYMNQSEELQSNKYNENESKEVLHKIDEDDESWEPDLWEPLE